MTRNLTSTWMRAGLFVGLVGLFWLSMNQARAEEVKEEFQTRLFFADPDGSNLKPVVEFAEYQSQGSPSWSLDGKLIGFDAWKPQKGETFSDGRVIVVSTDGTNPRRFMDAAMPSFSPDGLQMVFSRPKTGGVWVTNLSSQSEEDYVQVDAAGWGADWSRDGRIVYAIRTQQGANLRVVKSVDGRVDQDSGVDLLSGDQTPYTQVFWNMAWSADNKRIAYKAMNRQGKLEFGIVDARGDKFGLVTRDEGDLLASFAWSPDSSQILFVKKAPDKAFHQVFSAAPDSKDVPKPLAGLDPLRRCSDVAYSADGKRILVTCGPRMLAEKP